MVQSFVVRRFLGILALAALLAGLAVSVNLVNSPKPAHACAWGVEAYTGSPVQYDVFGNQTNTDITVYNDQCGNKYYRFSVWSPTGYPLTNVAVAGSIWVCGGFANGFRVYSSTYTTGAFHYGGCGRQATNTDGGPPGATACTNGACYDSANGGGFFRRF
jgi:hypothetical protein